MANTNAKQKRSSGRPKLTDDRNLHDVILESAIRLFAEHEPEKVTIRGIARDANVAASLIHHHFGSRSGLRSACCDHVLSIIQSVIEGLERDLPDGLSPSDLDLVGDTLVARLRERVHYLRFLALLFFKGDAEASRVFKRYFGILHTLTMRYAKAGLLRDDLNPQWVTSFMIYNQLGTIFLKGPMSDIMGPDLHSLENSTDRTRTFVEIAKRGMFRDDIR